MIDVDVDVDVDVKCPELTVIGVTCLYPTIMPSSSGRRRRRIIFVVSFLGVFSLIVQTLRLGTKVVPLDMVEEQASSPRVIGASGNFPLTTKNITVMVDLRAGWRDWGFSYFEADQLRLYGRFNYQIEWFHFTNDFDRLRRLANNPSSHACILVSNPKGLEEIRQEHAPHCKTWIINDEYCAFDGDIRHYFKQANVSSEIFIPLGPRYDFDRAYRHRYSDMTTSQLRSNPPKALPFTKRRYMFNAIFSKSTSPSRKELKAILLQSPKYASDTTSESTFNKGNPEYFIQIPGKWRRQMHPVFHVNSSQYVDILSQSKFTLSPTGHNPECFRLWESILMGSIPILAIGDEEYQTHKCPNALGPVLESALKDANVPAATIQQVLDRPDQHLEVLQDRLPFVVLNNWTRLEATLDRVLREGSAALQARQQRLQDWYFKFMRERVGMLEDYLLKDH